VVKRARFRIVRALGVLALVLVVLGGAVYQFRPDWLIDAEYARWVWRAGVERHDIQVADHRIAYYEGGAGTPVLLIHGFTGSKENWLPTARGLTDRFRVVMPDLPGWGDSSRLAGADYAIEPQVERLAALIDRLGLERMHLVGHSMGGQIAGLYAARHPERVLTLTLADTAGVHFEQNAFARRVLAGETPFNFSTREQFWAFMRELFDQPPWLPPRLVDVMVERNVTGHEFHRALLERLRQEPDALHLERSLDRIRVPTLILWCQRDRLLDFSSIDALRRGLTSAPKVEVAVFEPCSHMPMMEQPTLMAERLARFFAEPGAAR